ncbi:hypothetical protein [Salinivibrio proteolyticus]|uniref:Uncharacterized protein n=1 Tax=Salinivibrio proteolyticus TaxID=334715 RepID=A0ABY7LD03_9GAMM|nr:hypothetical protein [Salinivibrio proteolyticus]WBA15125.1 hypothetical protein N7E60_02085 [Salinivibrio proteolyticus]
MEGALLGQLEPLQTQLLGLFYFSTLIQRFELSICHLIYFDAKQQE